MAGEWRDVALGDLFKVKHGFAFKGEFFTDEPQSEVLVTPGNFAIGGGFQDDKRKYYRGPVPSDYVLQPGQIVVTMTDLSKQSDTLGFAARVPNDANVWLHNQRVGLLVFNPSAEADARFVEYLLRSHEYRAWVVGSATGTTVKHTSPSRIEAFRTLVPPPDEQRAIAHILGTLDDKIELNRRRNQTLEAMARALFKDWFVDFGPVRAKMEGQEPYLPADLWQLFPDRLDDEGTPEGWEMQPLDQIAALVTNSIAPGKTPEAVFEHYSIPAFDVGRMPAMEVGESIKSNKYIVDPDSVLVSKLNPQTPRVWLPAVATDRAICSTEFMQFVPHDRENRSYLYCLMSSGTMQEVVLQHVTGSTGSRQRAQPSQIAKVSILTPSPSVVMAFNRQAGPILKAVGENQRESQTLAQLRDTLLPKLISGELRIADAEKFVARVEHQTASRTGRAS
jgi:type I restriction enzyme S subunit